MSSKGKKKNKSEVSEGEIREKVESVFSSNPRQAYNYKQISKKLNINDKSERQIVWDVLRKLAGSGKIQEVEQGRFRARAEAKVYITGTVDMTRMGYGFIRSDEMEDDVFVSSANLRTAIHGDKVKVWLYAREKGRGPRERWSRSLSAGGPPLSGPSR